MRVLLVTEDIPAPQIGGLGRHVITLGNALIAAGHSAVLLGRSGVAGDTSRAGLGFDGDFIGGFDFTGMGWKEAQLGAWLPYKRRVMARRIEQAILRHAAGFDVVHYHGHLPMVGLGLPAGLNLVQTRHDQGSECITHLRFRASAPCDALAPAACAGCIHPAPGPLRRALSAAAVQQYRGDVAGNFAARKTIFVSDFLRRQFLRAVLGADLRRARVIHNFIDLARLRRGAAAAGPLQPGSLLLVGRMDEAKGFGAFLEAFVPLLAPGQQVLMVGDGPERAALQARHAGAAVHFMGWRDNAEVLALTRSAQACVVPSVLQEPCATTILEPLLLGRPTLALRRGGTPELALYQRYPGQLQLAADMPQLARLAAVALSTPAPALPLPGSSAADVASALPAVLGCYRDEDGDGDGDDAGISGGLAA